MELGAASIRETDRVRKSMSFRAMALVALVCSMVACGGSGTQGYRPPTIPSPVPSLSVTPSAVTLSVGESLTFAATQAGSSPSTSLGRPTGRARRGRQ
jgi:hypothetical protein